MRRNGGENRTIKRDDRGPARRSTLRAIALGLAASAAVRAGDEGPDLAPPLDLPAAAPIPTPPRTVVSTPSAGGPVLALPGITTPSARTPSGAASSPPPIESSLPALDAPIEMRNAPPAARSMQPPILESFTVEGSGEVRGPSTTTTPTSRPPARREPASTSSSSSAKPVAPPPRRPWFFGGARPGTAPAPAASPAARATTSPPGRAEVKDGSDPAAETALKRRIERQARAAIGDRARSLEVRVVGKQVAIEARGVRFIQKRGVRKALESLPALSGLRSSIAVLD